MIKCDECGEEFSFGRKINCCKSTHFGVIFTGIRKDYKWNCNPEMISHRIIEKSRYLETPEIKHSVILYE
ncbi:MAG: hypothetical protein ACFE9C_09485 [Candidatus Hodarchaeota archaeon]